jgi:hypothetical protein
VLDESDREHCRDHCEPGRANEDRQVKVTALRIRKAPVGDLAFGLRSHQRQIGAFPFERCR